MNLIDVDPVAWLQTALEGHPDLRSVELGVHGDRGKVVCVTHSGQQVEIRAKIRGWGAASA